MFFLRRTSTLSGIAYALVVLALSFFIGLTCALLLAQSVRNSPTRNWTRNFNAVIVGAAYTIIVSCSRHRVGRSGVQTMGVVGVVGCDVDCVQPEETDRGAQEVAADLKVASYAWQG